MYVQTYLFVLDINIDVERKFYSSQSFCRVFCFSSRFFLFFFRGFVDDLSSVDSKGLSDKICDVLVRRGPKS